MTLINPYIQTYLSSPIELLPEQMNCDMLSHLKNNLEKKILNRCYKEHGFIKHIYEIVSYDEGKIHPEDQNCAAIFLIKFSCQLCIPIVNKQIICVVDRSNRTMLRLTNGPIIVIVTYDRINLDNFVIDENFNIYTKKGSQDKMVQNNSLEKGDHVVLTIVSKMFNDMDTFIMTIGFLERKASQNEVKEYYKN